MGTVTLYTHNDLDGCACILVGREYAKKIDALYAYETHNYHTAARAVAEYCASPHARDDVLLIGDLHLPTDTLNRIEYIRKHFGVTVIMADHHPETAVQAANFHTPTYPWLAYAEDQCGSLLLYNKLDLCAPHLHADLLYVDAWDRWQLNSEHREKGEELQLLFWFMGMVGITTWWKEAVDKECSVLYGMEHTTRVLRVREADDIAKASKKVRRFVVHGVCDIPVGVLFREEVGEYGFGMLKEHLTEYTVLVIVSAMSESVSLRSTEFDVNSIAAAAGGGGHRQASGFQLRGLHYPVTVTDEWCGDLLHKLWPSCPIEYIRA